MSDITNRWDSNYYLTNDQYEDTNKYFKDAFKKATISAICSHVTNYNPIYLSNTIKEYTGFIFRNLKIKKIIFNPPATVIIWGDDTKTVVKCSEDDKFNPEIGVAMCYMKKIYGSRHAFSKKVESYIEE